MEASTQLNDTSKISNFSGIGGNYDEKGLGIFYHDKVSPDADQVVHMSVSKAEKRLKKLERDYQHTYENYIETRSNRFRFYIDAKHSNYRSGQAGNAIIYYKKLREQLQNNLDKMNKAEETERGVERPDYFKYSQSRIPKSSNSKTVHDLLRKFKDTEKLREKAIIANGENVNNNPTSQDSLKTSIEMEIKLLTKVIKKLGKEMRGRETRIWTDNGHEEKMRHLEKKCEWICGKWDEEKKYIVGLKKNT
ncbi:PREDICTED: uncharacterized protein LOC104712054 [Camelina sativa]|uniref:Uncharacterized protein LOC104712054 n=1 Tax=Camelina sativa TaxID=90675 RepID=A0ABM0TJ47_CAMSA|nr:PREDICTED: uncharacterized protein LOC104712054 [Camelina sativa]